MIQIAHLETGFLVYLAFMLVGLCALIVGDLWRAQVREWHVSVEQLRRCDRCDFTFVVRRTETSVRCPRCSTRCSMRRRL